MKRFFTVTAAVFIFLCFSGGFSAFAQRNILPSNFVGVNLKDVQKEYLRQVNRGNDSLVAPYADALFFDGQMIKAYEMYVRADSSDYPLQESQKRNFTHAAKRLGRTSPYSQTTDYFDRSLKVQTEVSKYGINSAAEDFAPFVWGDQLFVTSSRAVITRRNQDTYAFTQLPFLAVFAFDKDRNTVQTDFLPELNTSLHDGPLAISKDTSLVIITRNYKKPNEHQLQNLYLEYFTYEEGSWSAPKSFPYNNPAFSVQHPFYHDESNTLYFSSDMPGSYGGFDIFKSVWDGEEWGKPENIGSDVNSSYDEVFPVISPLGALFYSTNHIETMGGLDLVVFQEGKRFLLPEPFNTVYDDLSITFVDESSGYFASNRNQSVFNDDIYSFNLKPFPFIVRVLDSKSLQPISGVRIAFNAENPAINGVKETLSSGESLIHTGFTNAFPVYLVLTKDGYTDHELTTDEFVFKEDRWVLTVYMDVEPATAPRFLVIYFDNDFPDPRSLREITDLQYDQTFSAYKLRWPEFYARSASSEDELRTFFSDAEKGMQELKELAAFLLEEHQKGQRYLITFTSHASPLAADDYNLTLSKRRFHAVENFLLRWNGGALIRYIESGLLLYENNPYGSSRANPNVSANPSEPGKSIFSVEASRERRVNISLERTAN